MEKSLFQVVDYYHRHEFALLDARSSKCALEAFLELATEELAHSTTPGVTELTAIGKHVSVANK